MVKCIVLDDCKIWVKGILKFVIDYVNWCCGLWGISKCLFDDGNNKRLLFRFKFWVSRLINCSVSWWDFFIFINWVVNVSYWFMVMLFFW